MPADHELASIKYLRGRSTTPTSGRSTTPTPTFAMFPAEVLLDPRLNKSEKIVYAVMSYFRRGEMVTTGQRRLADAADVDRRSLRRCIKSLIEFGHLEKQPRPPGMQSQDVYRLTAILFSIPSFAPDPPPIAAVFTAPLITCPKCKKSCGGVLKVGWCRACNWTMKVKQVIREDREEHSLPA